MINWKIRVGQPRLSQGMAFIVRYRRRGDAAWTNFLPNPTTNEFTIEALENGAYEAEVRTQCANGQISAAAYVYGEGTSTTNPTTPGQPSTGCYITLKNVSFPGKNISIAWETNAAKPYESSPAATFEWSVDGASWAYLGTELIDAHSTSFFYPSGLRAGLPLYIRARAETPECGPIVSNTYSTAGIPAESQSPAITWEDGTNADKVGDSQSVTILDNVSGDKVWMVQLAGDYAKEYTPSGKVFPANVGVNGYVLKSVINGVESFSNTLYYTRNAAGTTTPPTNPQTECRSHYVSLYANSGDSLDVSYTDCEGNPGHEVYYAQGHSDMLSTRFCARVGSVQTNGYIDIGDECSEV